MLPWTLPCHIVNQVGRSRAVRYHHDPWWWSHYGLQNMSISFDVYYYVQNYSTWQVMQWSIPEWMVSISTASHAYKWTGIDYPIHRPSSILHTYIPTAWSLGCLLFAMAFGYSPFECEFSDAGKPRVVECTFLRVIGKIPYPTNHRYVHTQSSQSSRLIYLSVCLSVYLSIYL